MTRTVAVRVADALRRIDALDRRGPRLNAIPTTTPDIAARAQRSDGPLRGRTLTVKDSFAVRGLPLSAGSPAFASITASRDATLVQRLTEAGAVLLGKTAMPPVAIGGGQPGVHGRTVSPFNPRYLAAAWHSGSSIGSGVAVGAGLCDLGLGEETVSSGRSPASNNAVVAYTPSWGVLSSVGNLPLHPYRDVPVPHTPDVSSVRMMLAVLAGADDEDVWYRQSAVSMQAAARLIERLRDPAADPHSGPLRLGVPRRYIGEPDPAGDPAPIRRSVRALWDATAQVLREAGIELVEVPFPLADGYEDRGPVRGDFHPAAPPVQAWTAFELGPLMTFAWSAFLRDFGDGTALADLNPAAIRPNAPDATDLTYRGEGHPGRDAFDFARIVQEDAPTEFEVVQRAENAVGLFDAARREQYEAWLDELGLDGLIFPANGDIAPADAGRNQSAARQAWRDGSVFSHGNHVLRRVGIPSVTLPMGLLPDLRMPVGLTVCGRAWSDDRVLAVAERLERLLPDAPRPLLDDAPAPADPHEPFDPSPSLETVEVSARAVAQPEGSRVRLEVTVETTRDVRIEVLGETFEPAPDRSITVDVERDVWDTVARPLALVTAVDPERPVLGVAAVALEYEDDLVVVEGA